MAGTAALDSCGICTGGNTAITPNFAKDTCGVCFGNGLSCAPCQAIQIADLVLVDATTNADIASLTNNYLIVKSSVGPFSARADVCYPGSVESVRFFLNGSLTKNENLAPYSISGDQGGNYNSWNIASGFYQVTATPYSSTNGNGTTGISKLIDLWIFDTDPFIVRSITDKGDKLNDRLNQQGDLATNPPSDPNSVNQDGASNILLKTWGELIFRVFRNPTTAMTNVELMHLSEPASLMLIDASGKVLAERNLKVDQGQSIEEFDLSGYPDDMYLIKLYSGDELRTQRVVRQ